MEFSSPEGEQRYAALVRSAADAVVGLDFDGTLAPIVEDPASAHIHDDAADVLVELADKHKADVIVVGNKGMKRKLLGSVPNSVAHNANCSVFVVKTT